MHKSARWPLLVIFIFSLFLPTLTQAKTIRFGALPLQPVPGGEDFAWLGSGMDELLRLHFGYISRLAISTGYGQYTSVQKWGKDLPYAAKDAQIIPVINDLGVDMFIFGRYQGFFDQLKIEVQLGRNNERNRLVKVVSQQYSSANIGEMVGKVVLMTMAQANLQPTPAESVWLERHPTDSFYAFKNYGQATLAYRQGHLEQALNLADSAITNDENFLEARVLRAEIIFSLGRYNETITAFEETANKAIALLGNNHPQVLAIRSRYGQILQLFGYTAVAQKELLAARELAINLFGADHPVTATVLNNLATTYTAQGQAATATKLLEQALLTVNRRLGTKHPQVAELSGNLAMVHYTQNNFQQAIHFARLATDLAELNLYGDDPNLAYRYNQLALCLTAKNLYSEALVYAKKALDIFDKSYGENHPMTIQNTSDVGAIYFASGAHERALEFYRKALKLSKDLYGENSSQVAQELSNVAAVYFQMTAYEQSRILYEQALVIFQQQGLAAEATFVRKQLQLIQNRGKPQRHNRYYLW